MLTNMLLIKLFLVRLPGTSEQAITCWEVHQNPGNCAMPLKHILQPGVSSNGSKEVTQSKTHKVEIGGTNRSKQSESGEKEKRLFYTTNL